MVSDTFTGAAGALTSPWSRYSGPAIMELNGSGRVQMSATGGQSHEALYASSVSTLAQYAEIQIIAFGLAAPYVWGIVRASGTDSTRNNIQVSGGGFDNNIYLTRVTNGSGVDFATINRGTPLAIGDVLRIEIDGNGTNPVIIAKVNGTAVGSPTTYTGTLNQVGSAGFGMYSGNGGGDGFTADNFEAGDIGGGGPSDLTFIPQVIVVN